MPNATAGSIFDRQSNRIQEVLNKSMRVFLAGLDPVWRDNVVTSQGVGNSGDLGRDLLRVNGALRVLGAAGLLSLGRRLPLAMQGP